MLCENWFLFFVNLLFWCIVFINIRWCDWLCWMLVLFLMKIRMEMNIVCKLISCMFWKLILLWGFLVIDLFVIKRKKCELIVFVIWRYLLNEEEGRSRWFVLFCCWFFVIFCYYCILSVCCRDVFYEFVVNFMLLLMIFKDDFKILKIWYYRFFELIYFFFERKKI